MSVVSAKIYTCDLCGKSETMTDASEKERRTPPGKAHMEYHGRHWYQMQLPRIARSYWVERSCTVCFGCMAKIGIFCDGLGSEQ